jgi:hypothetical protein
MSVEQQDRKESKISKWQVFLVIIPNEDTTTDTDTETIDTKQAAQ